MKLNNNYYQESEIDIPLLCDECLHPCHSDDAITDDYGTLVFCGALRGNGCAEKYLQGQLEGK